MADAYGIAHDIGLPWLALAIALPLIVLVANAVAWLPGRAAARLRPAEALRAE
jgi:ABC-type antimicrobial peptide transport system permease subunit